MKNARFDQCSRCSRNCGSERARQIGIAVVAGDAVGAIDDFAAIDGTQLSWFAASCGKREAYERRDREAESAARRHFVTGAPRTHSRCATRRDCSARHTVATLQHQCAEAEAPFKVRAGTCTRECDLHVPAGELLTSGSPLRNPN